MSSLRKIIFLVLFFSVLPFSESFAFEFKLGKRFFNYGNGSINLDNVTYVSAKMPYVITLSSDNREDFFLEYNASVTDENVVNTLDFLKPEFLESLPYYFIKIGSHIIFDSFELTVLKTETFLKLPRPDQIVSAEEIEKVNLFFRKLAEELGLDPSSSEDKTQIYREVNLMTEEKYNIIQEKLKLTSSTYSKIVN